MRGDALRQRRPCGLVGHASHQSALGLFPGRPTPRLYDRVVEALRTRHYSRRTEEAYIHWILRFILFHNRSETVRAGRIA